MALVPSVSTRRGSAAASSPGQLSAAIFTRGSGVDKVLVAEFMKWLRIWTLPPWLVVCRSTETEVAYVVSSLYSIRLAGLRDPRGVTPQIEAATAQPTRQSSQWLSGRDGWSFHS
jgi:hypothetical protein